MKKLFTYIVIVVIPFLANAQFTFIPPSSSTPEYYNPLVISPNINDVFHTCAYSSSNDNYIYSWSPNPGSVNTNDAGFVIKSAVFGTEPYQIYDNVSFIDVGIIYVGDIRYIFTSYYKLGDGHFYDIWEWDPINGNLSAFSLNNRLSNSNIGTKISMDAHKNYALIISWVEDDHIFLKGFNSSAGVLETTDNVRIDNAPNPIVPDIAFGHPNGEDLKVRIVYIEQGTSNINVISENFDFLFGTTSVNFMNDYVQNLSPNLSFVANSDFDHAILSLCLQIDCPDHGLEDYWSYIYTIYGNNFIHSVSKYNNFSPPVLMDLSNSLQGSFLTIAYDSDDQKIHYGWYTQYPSSGIYPNIAGYLSVERFIDGSFSTPPNTFLKITNPNTGFSKPILTFSRNNDYSNLFVAYPYVSPFGVQKIAHKILPWGMSTFKSTAYS